MPAILVSGSLAYDRIFDFDGVFADHILPDKIHALNVSFYVPEMEESFGGCAGNIAYTLALLGETPLIVGRGGNDFEAYRTWLEKNRVPTGTIETDEKLRTSSATILTDRNDNQIAAFYPGAGNQPYRKEFPESNFAIIGPGNPDDMRKLPGVMRERRTPFIFDPGQQLPVLSGEDLKNGIEGAEALISNGYELSLIMQKTGWNAEDILAHAKTLVTTLGAKGSCIRTNSETFDIPPAHPENTSDPTGAGDAYRAGFVVGLLKSWPLPVVGRFASVVACYTVERRGTQTHSFTWDDVRARYQKNFGESLPA